MRASIITDRDREGAVRKLMTALERLGYEATVSDLVAATGIPAGELEEVVNLMSKRYNGSHRVTESGEIVYRFSHAFRAAHSSAALVAKAGSRAGHGAESALRWMVERWPVALLGGYFTIFLALPYPPALIALAVLLGTWSDLGYVDAGEGVRPKWRVGGLRVRETLHEYLFGIDVEARRWEENSLLEVLSFVRDHKGIVSSREIMQVTGQSPERTQEYVGRLLLTYSGEPKVTEFATVVYRFPELMHTMSSARRIPLRGGPEPISVDESCDGVEGHERRFRIVGIANYVNLLFGFYYGLLSLKSMLSGSPVPGLVGPAHQGGSLLFDATYAFMAGAHLTATLPTMFVFLGALPFGIAAAFLALHRSAQRRKGRWRREKEERRLRKAVYAQVFLQPELVDPEQILMSEGMRRRKGARKAIGGILDEFASTYHGEIDDIGQGHFVYHFPELEREIRDVERMRDSVDPSLYDVGRIVFDSRDRVK